MSVNGEIRSIVVVGGGIGGLAFAIGVGKLFEKASQAPPRVVVLEKCASREAKMEANYGIAIRGDTGVVGALRVIELERSVASLERTRSRAFGLFRTNGADDPVAALVRFPQHEALSPQASFRVPRGELWACLLDEARKFANVEVRFGVAVERVVAQGASSVRVELDGSAPLDCELCVVADGNRSAVRGAMLPHEKLQFRNVVAIGGVAQVDAVPAPLDTHFGLIVSNAGHRTVFANAEGANEVLWVGTHWFDSEDEARRFAARENLLQEEIAQVRREFGPPLSEIVTRTVPTRREVRLLLYDKDPHAHVGRVVFIGDSNHPVTPFSGNGAGLAIQDGVQLSQLLVDVARGAVAPDDALARFDVDQRTRAQRSLAQGRLQIAIFHATTSWRIYLRDIVLSAIGFIASWL